MKDTPPHLRVLEEIEEAGIPGLLEVLREGHRRRQVRPVGRDGMASGLLSPGLA